MLEQGRRLAEVGGFGDRTCWGSSAPDSLVVLFFLRTAEEQDRQLGMGLAQLLEQREVVIERPAPEGEVLGAAGADMNAEPLAPGPVMPREEVLGPFRSAGDRKIS